MSIDTNRYEFEEWAMSNTSIGLDLDMDENTNHYCDISTYAAWEAWKEAKKRQDELLKILRDIQDYRKSNGKYDFYKLPYEKIENAVFDAQQELESRITKALNH
jgi:hypothetical protein